MDEEITIINEKTRNEKIKNFLVEKKKLIISLIVILILIVLSFYSYQIFQDKKKEKLSDKYNSAIIDYSNGDKTKITLSMKEVIKENDSTYSPLALYFLIDNDLIENKSEINELFDILINKTSLENEIKNLIIYKKALFNADTIKENELLKILKPITNSDSVWKSHALYLLGEFFYSKGEVEKSKDFFEKIILIKNPNPEIVISAQRRLNRDFSD